MKTKLLKKVRKRFEIVKVTEPESNPAGFIFYEFKDHTFPCYIIIRKSFLSSSFIVRQTYEESIKELLGQIHLEFDEKLRHRDRKQIKVWW